MFAWSYYKFYFLDSTKLTPPEPTTKPRKHSKASNLSVSNPSTSTKQVSPKQAKKMSNASVSATAPATTKKHQKEKEDQGKEIFPFLLFIHYNINILIKNFTLFLLQHSNL